MRQAVPLLISQAPYVGTGLEFRAAIDTGDVLLASRAGKVELVDAERILIGPRTSSTATTSSSTCARTRAR